MKQTSPIPSFRLSRRRSRRIVEDWLSVELIDLMMISVLSCLLIRGGFEERQGGRVLLSLKGFLS